MSAQHPAALAEACRQFRDWRNRQRHPGRIPDRLWALAARAANRCGVEHTAEALGVDPNRLQAQMHRLGFGSDSTDHREFAEPQFLELTPLPFAPQPRCSIELEEPSGRKLKFALEGGAVAHAAELLAVLRKEASA